MRKVLDGFGKKSCVSTGVTNCHDMTLAVKVVLNPNTTNQHNECIYKIEIRLGRVETIVDKVENAGFQHFSPFPTMFSKSIFLKVVKNHGCVQQR